MTVDDLVDELDSAGDLPAEFGPVLRKVPREWFIPSQAWVKENGAYQPIDRNADSGRWLRAVYSNRSVVTQFDDGRTEWPGVGDRPTCSASMPSVVVAMLSAVSVADGDSVMEVGTGTGFNAALASTLAGPGGAVVTVEIDPALAATARKHLIGAGYSRVVTVVGDGASGLGYAPFDKVIVTAGVHIGRLPYAWVEQTRPGGVIVVPMRGDLASGPLVRFVVHEDGTATGRTMPIGVGFMELRGQRTPTTSDRVLWNDAEAEVSQTGVDAEAVLCDPASRCV